MYFNSPAGFTLVPYGSRLRPYIVYPFLSTRHSTSQPGQISVDQVRIWLRNKRLSLIFCNTLHRAAQSMAQQHKMCQGAKSAWDGCQERGNFFDTGKVDVAHDFPVEGIDARVEHDSAWFDHIGGDAGGSPNADHQNIGAARDAGEVLRMRMTNGHGGVLAHKHERGGLAADVAAPDDHRVSPGNRNTRFLQHGQNDIGCRRDEAGEAQQQVARIARPQSINVLLRV